MTKKECIYCAKYIPDDEEYCCDEHEAAHKESIVNREKAVAAGIPAERTCGICGHPLTLQTLATVHRGECRKIFNARRSAAWRHVVAVTDPEKYQRACGKRFEPKPKLKEYICLNCKEPFMSTRPAEFCKKIECKRARGRRCYRRAMDSMTAEERKEHRAKQNDSHRELMSGIQLPKRTITAKCPYCGEIYTAKVEGDYKYLVMPRILHERCRLTVARIEAGYFDRIEISQMQEISI